eukprot:5840934-Prorocentrum_lima.AAC.1
MEFKDIQWVRLANQSMANDYLVSLVDDCSLLGHQGGMTQVTDKKSFATYSYNEEYAQSCRH